MALGRNIGMLSGDPRGALDPNMYYQRGQALGQQMGQSLGMLAGRDMRTGEQIAAAEENQYLQALADPSKTSQELFSLSQQAINSGYTDAGGQILKAAQAALTKEQDAARRKTLSDSFEKYGYNTLANMAKDPTADMTELQKELTKIELTNVKGAKSRPARREMLKAAGFPQQALQDLEKGKFDSYSVDEFAEMVSSQNAELEIFLDPKTGKPKPYRVNEYGLVEDPSTPNKFVQANILGLEQAPQQIKQLATGDSITKNLTDGYTKSYLELYDNALNANDVLRTNAIAQAELDKGIKTGIFATGEMFVARFAKALGATGEFTEDISSTEVFMTQRAEQVLKLIKALGTGTAVSNTDREYVEKIVGGQIGLDETTLKRLLELERDYSQQTISKANQANNTLRKVVSKNGTIKTSDDLTILDSMRIDPYQAAKTIEQRTAELKNQGYSDAAIQLALEDEGYGNNNSN